MYAQEDLGISFDDVAGIDEDADELREVVEFLRSPEKYQVLVAIFLRVFYSLALLEQERIAREGNCW